MNSTNAMNNHHDVNHLDSIDAYAEQSVAPQISGCDDLEGMFAEFGLIKGLMEAQGEQLQAYAQLTQQMKQQIAALCRLAKVEKIKADRWENRHWAVRAERDEYYGRLVKLYHGEKVDNLVAPATIPCREEVYPPGHFGAPLSIIAGEKTSEVDEERWESGEVIDYLANSRRAAGNEDPQKEMVWTPPSPPGKGKQL